MRNKKAPIKEDATNEQSAPTFSAPVFLGCNEVAKNNYIYSVQALFNEAQAIAEILRAKGLPVDKGTITDSLTMRKVISTGAEVETCENCEHLDEAFKKMVHDELESMKSQMIKDKLERSMRADLEAMKDEILQERTKFDEINNQEKFRNLFVFANGTFGLPEDLERLAEEATGFWIRTEEQFAAWQDHKQAAAAITRFLQHFPNSVWPSTMQEIGNLFKSKEDGSGELEPQFVDYSLYI